MNYLAFPFFLSLPLGSPKQHKQTDFNWQPSFLANGFFTEVQTQQQHLENASWFQINWNLQGHNEEENFHTLSTREAHTELAFWIMSSSLSITLRCVHCKSCLCSAVDRILWLIWWRWIDGLGWWLTWYNYWSLWRKRNPLYSLISHCCDLLPQLHQHFACVGLNVWSSRIDLEVEWGNQPLLFCQDLDNYWWLATFLPVRQKAQLQ